MLEQAAPGHKGNSRPPSEAGETQCAGLFRVHADFAPLLKRHGLFDCDALFDSQTGTLLRRLPSRENWRLDLSDEDGRTRTLYLKKHHARTIGTWLRARLGLTPPSSPARTEAETTVRLTELGVPTMTVAAYGQRLRPDGTLVAAFLSDELRGFEQLDLFLPARFAAAGDADLRTLIQTVADVASRFHWLGFNHRDLYTCHFFISETLQGLFDVHLIDLQRVQRWPRVFRRRWHIKDLAQLCYSTDPRLVTKADRMRFLLRYLDADRLDDKSKRFAKRVLAKAAALERKHGSYRDWSRPTVLFESDNLRMNPQTPSHANRACA